MDAMEMNRNESRAELARQALAILKKYEEFPAIYRVDFTLAQPTAEGLPRLAGRIYHRDGTPLAQNSTELDKKLGHLKDDSIVIRPFFLPMARAQWDDSDANTVSKLDFDYAAIIGYRWDDQGKIVLRDLYFLPTDALLADSKQDEDGVWRKIPLATFNAHRLSLEPRKKFARFLYLSERIKEAMEYQYDKCGYFFSTKD